MAGSAQTDINQSKDQLIDFYKGKKVLVTGHTGFKGSWLCRILKLLGAEVYGYSLDPPTEPNLYTLLKSDEYVDSKIGDVADYDALSAFYQKVSPDVVLHLAAQPIVREGYRDPRGTYNSNVMGTVNIMECVRQFGAKSFLNVTTDKVYENLEQADHHYSEGERLDGFDPYSNSKSCSELVTHCYVRSFPEQLCPVSTARAGNVIGGGDFASERIVPDCVRAAITGNEVILRNPNSVRPYQHVLEPVCAYLMIAAKQYEDGKYAGYYNVGPDESDCVTTGDIVDIFCEYWNRYSFLESEEHGGSVYKELTWINKHDGGPHEANFLKLDCSLVKQTFGWKPVWNIDKAIEMVVKFSKRRLSEPEAITDEMNAEIREFFGE